MQSLRPARMALVLVALFTASCGPAAAPSSAPAPTSPPAAAAPTAAQSGVASPAVAPLGSATSAPGASPAAATKPAASPAAVASPSPAVAAASAVGTRLPPLNPPVKVVVADNQTTGTADVYIALDRGYYDEEGLQIDLQPMIASEVAQTLASGQISFGIANPDAGLFNAMGRGLNIKMLAALTRNKPGDSVAAFMVRKDIVDSGQYTSPKDLKGKTVGIPALQSQFYVDLFMQKDGLSASDLNIVMMQPADIVAGFASKTIDAAWNAEPQDTLAVQRGLAVEVAVTGDLFPGAVGSTLALSPQFAQAQPEAAQRFVYATLRGHEDYYHAFIAKDVDRSGVVQIMVNHTPIKDPKLWDVLGLASVDRVPVMDTTSWDVLQAYFVKISLEEKTVDLAQFVDNSYIQAAAQRLGISS